MLGKTSISAIRTLMLLAQQPRSAVLSPRKMAEILGESPTYLAKVVRHLVKVAILAAEKGVKGGVRLLLPPEKISLLAVVEACQGTIVPDYCRSAPATSHICGFHRAADELHRAITGVLQNWTLADLLVTPSGSDPGAASGGINCLMRREPLDPEVGTALVQFGSKS